MQLGCGFFAGCSRLEGVQVDNFTIDEGCFDGEDSVECGIGTFSCAIEADCLGTATHLYGQEQIGVDVPCWVIEELVFCHTPILLGPRHSGLLVKLQETRSN